MRERAARRRRPVILLLREGVFASSMLDVPAVAERCGSLGPYLQKMLARQQLGEASLGGVFGEARSYARQLRVLRFCLNDLLPQLRASGRGRAQVGGSGQLVSGAAFRMLQSRACGLLQCLDQPLPPLEVAGDLAALAGVPCALLGRIVMPLSPVTHVVGAQGPMFTIAGKRYTLDEGRARPLSKLLRDVRLEQERRVEQGMRDRPELTERATEFVRDLKAILDPFRLRDSGRSYQFFYHDDEYQLQHSRGHVVLVRGPVAIRAARGKIFVGLPLIGESRRKWLNTAPRPGSGDGDFWTPDGTPLMGGLCMGDSSQYANLLTSEFTDAEAVVEWLDAGVILATGRSAQHRMRRAAGQGRADSPLLAG